MPTLAKYWSKRDFAQTAEPRGEKRRAAGHAYVIQKHAASHLHYDFRLQLGGVLLSWAVPKGPSLDPSVRRLAVETEPHPLEYGKFEGSIPEDQYGGGTVMVWDRGSWTPEGDAQAAYDKGHLTFSLQGDKLQGRWHLVRTPRASGGKSNWLLFKSKDEFARAGDNTLVEAEPNSVLSGRTMAQIAKQKKSAATAARTTQAKPQAKKAEGMAKVKVVAKARSAKAKSPKAARATPEAAIPEGAKPSPLPKQPEPELATLVDAAPEGEDWLHEIKYDGYRILALVNAGKVTLLTRNGKDWTDRLPALAAACAKLDVKSALFDGELVALDEHGVSNFQALQNALNAEQSGSLVYYVFDLLHWNGLDLTQASLLARKALLARVLGPKHAPGSLVRLSEHVLGNGSQFFAQAAKLGLEGIVSKRARSVYRAGRGKDWLKTKCGLRQEFALVGYTEPAGSRSHFGALLLGVEREGKLSYAGRVGTGFSERSLSELWQKLVPLERKTAAFEHELRGAELRGVHWLKPSLVAEISFTAFTEDGVLRHPVFHGLRDDKTGKEAKWEIAEHASAKPASDEPAASSNKRRASPRSATPKQKHDTTTAPGSYPITHPEKLLYPEAGIIKREVLEYYELVAERMLPHVKNRPLTLVRCPQGHGKPSFFQKHPGKGTPTGLRSVAIRESEGKMPYSVIDDAQGLFGLVQLGALEIHTWGSAADDFERPNLLVFDLDPDPSLKFGAVVAAAHRLRALFQTVKLESFVKTTGGKGLHVCLPIAADLSWDEVKQFSKRVAEELVRESPDKYLATQSKAKRTGKIYLDYLRNARGATFIAPYSTRDRDHCPIATPVEWDELDRDFDPSAFTLRTLKARLAQLPHDPFERMATLEQRLRAP